MINKIFFKVKKCPLCGSTSFKNHKPGYRNRYSEMLSVKLKIQENALLNLCKNLECNKCGIIYKQNWFEDKILRELFNKDIPVHPKGWDKYTKKFSRSYFLKQFNKLCIEQNEYKKNFLIRDLNSIINSIDENELTLKNKKMIKSFNKSLLSNTFSSKDYLAKKISIFIKKPRSLSRFSGLGSKELISHLEGILPNFTTYIETGCPLWGNLEILKKKGLKKIYYSKLRSSEFWGDKCKKKNENCSQKIKSFCKLKSIYDFKQKNLIDISCNFLMLDHLKNPNQFIKKIFSISKVCSFILEDPQRGVPIQHFTGWTKKPIIFLSKKFNKKIKFSISSFKKSELKLYTFY